MKKTTVVNIYNFIRMSHQEPSTFIEDDFETVEKQLIMVKQYGFAATYALKYDALVNPRYQALLRHWLDENDELSAWWEISEPLCLKAGVHFRGHYSDEHDDRVDSAYSIGYTPMERKKLVDAYMSAFYHAFGRYPATIGAWVLDAGTLEYAAQHYGVQGAAICRDQIGTDGFTLWGGYPNGPYYPSRENIYVPAQNRKNQISVPVFRLLGPDPIYNFEQNLRPECMGVYSMEPSCVVGRDPKWISWYFHDLMEEDSLGIQYVQVGQENNFLWENIQPGLEIQLRTLRDLAKEGKVRVETMSQTAQWFQKQYRITPPMSFQASKDWNDLGLTAQWYACANYRLGLLGEGDHLRIRDAFLYRQNYTSRYRHRPLTTTASLNDALPLLFPQAWAKKLEQRPYLRFLDEHGQELSGDITYGAISEDRAIAELRKDGELLFTVEMEPMGLHIHGNCTLCADALPVFRGLSGSQINMSYAGYAYDILLNQGKLTTISQSGFRIAAQDGEIFLQLGGALEPFRVEEEIPLPKLLECRLNQPTPPPAPKFLPGDALFDWGTEAEIYLASEVPGEIRFTLDGTEPTLNSMVYTGPLHIREDTFFKAKLYTSEGQASAVVQASYRFGLKNIELSSKTHLDPRTVFHGNGITDLLCQQRGSLDYLDGRWRGTLEDLEIVGTLPDPHWVKSISLGFLSHHRCGVIYPQWVELYLGESVHKLRLYQRLRPHQGPCDREIAKTDLYFPVNQEVTTFKLLIHRHEFMPQWCCYKGVPNVFTMVDNLVVQPSKM